MPVTKVTVTAEFAEIKAASACADVPADVLPGSYCYDAVSWAIENSITNGLADGTFSPGSGCTRAQIVTFLFRAPIRTSKNTRAGGSHDPPAPRFIRVWLAGSDRRASPAASRNTAQSYSCSSRKTPECNSTVWNSRIW